MACVNVKRLRFIRAWQTSEGAKECLQRLRMTPEALASAYVKERERGTKLKALKGFSFLEKEFLDGV